MNRFLDYLLLRTPKEIVREGVEVRRAEPGQVSTSRLALALGGLLLGIAASFLVSGIASAPGNADQDSTVVERSAVTGERASGDSLPSGEGPKVIWPRRGDWARLAVITFVICMLTFPALYQSLRLYRDEPSLLVLFVAFQHGFFWQSVIGTGAKLLGA